MEYDQHEKMSSITLGDITTFFTWRLDQKCGMNKRQLPGIKKTASLDSYRKLFSIVYRRWTGNDIDSKLLRKTLIISNTLVLLNKEH